MSLDFDENDLLDFKEEGWRHVAALEASLLSLEQGPFGEERQFHISEAFRAAHSLKGAAGLLGLEGIAELTHEAENLLGLIRSGKRELGRAESEALFQAVDALRKMLEALGLEPMASAVPSEATRVLRELVSVGVDASGSPGILEKPQSGDRTRGSGFEGLPPADRLWQERLSADNRTDLRRLVGEGKFIYDIHVDLDACRWVGKKLDHWILQRLEMGGTVLAIHTNPSLDGLEQQQGTFDLAFRALYATSAEPPVLAVFLRDRAAGVIQIDPRSLLVPSSSGGQTVTGEQSGHETDRSVADSGVAGAGREGVAGASHGSQTAGQRLVRVSAERLDMLVNVVGELVVGHTRLERISADLAAEGGRGEAVAALLDTQASVARLMEELQRIVMQLRMFPLERVFNRFPRLVRDLARSLGKEIRLEVSGQDTELDKTLIEELEDPLVHLIRNASDHGLEPPDERERAGKPRCGTIRLAAQREGSHIVISVQDDGRGIDPERILDRARSLGLVSEPADEADPLRFIFHPGFSTAQKITNVSGRGVGLDVVQQNLRRIKGTIQVDSQVGKGTRFRIRIPLTLAITRALLVRAGESPVAIPLDAVRESIRVASREIRTVRNQEVIQLRGCVVPLLRLNAVLGRLGGEDHRAHWPVVIAEAGEALVGLVVDDLVGEQDIVIKQMGELLGSVRGLSGVSVLGDGRIALVLDTTSLVERAQISDKTARTAAA